MAEILKEWLTERLQRPINWNAEEFGEVMKNGYIIAGVLHSYHVINDEKHFLVRSSNAREEIKNNWSYLSEWLKEIDVHLPDVELENIMEGRGSSLLRLFYQLFLQLDRRDRTDFIKRERQMVSELVDKVKNRFKVANVADERESTVDDLAKPLLNEKHYIDWQRKKTKQVQDTYNYIRHKYSKMLAKIEDSEIPMQFVPTKGHEVLTSREKKDMDAFSKRFPCKFENFTYEELLSKEQKAVERSKTFSDSEWASNYMNNLFTKMHIQSDTEEFQKQAKNVLSGSLWDLSVGEEEMNFDIGLAKKVMKLSQFEKQMCTQIMETKQQARNLVRNRIEGEKEFSEERTQQFNQFLDNLKEQIHSKVVEIDFERKRQNTLHKKLYAEKIKRKRQHYYEICYDTMLSIVDYATKYAYFKKLIDDDIPNHFLHEWRTLYFKQQPIFDILDPTEDILKDPGVEEECTPHVEEIVRLELDRQEALNDNEFKEYHNYSYPWTLDLLIPNYDPESEERKYEYLGTRVLGHVVYTLLEMKYPYPPPREPADLPQFAAKVLLRGLPDRSITVHIQVLLNMRKIFVARLECAINLCLRKFKSEMVGCADIELSFDKFINAAQEEQDKELIKLMKAEDDTSISKSNDVSVAAMLGTMPPNTKQTQTPKTIPEEEMILSPAADLGKYAYESLSSGDSLTDHLVAAMLVELIKDQHDICGFVIINYPNTYREAQILEETFSGRAPPDETVLEDRDDIYLEETIAKHRKKEKDQYKEIRISKLVNDPHKKRIEKPFESYFTSYVHMKETEDILQELVIWDLSEDNSELIDRFYAILGINYSMYYETIDKDFLSQLCKYIIGDYSMPLKSCDELFGEQVLSQLDFPSSDDKRIKSKIIKPEISNGKSKEKLSRQGSKNQSSKTAMNNELEIVKAPERSKEEIDEMIPLLGEVGGDDMKAMSSEIILLAGEEDWDYGEIPIPEIIGISLASCWEMIEKVYIEDMKQLFFAKRLQMNSLVPYARFIKDKMEQVITMPSLKQDLVSQFQRDYNDFENDWRDINVSKNEWHCRVKELQTALYLICDDRKLFAEQQRQSLIGENWTMEELTTMVNTYISCMQTELNRFFLTYQSLHDFYFSMLKRLPPNDRPSSKELTKISREADDTSGSKRGGEDKIFRQLKNAFQELQLKNIQINYSNNPFNMVIENNVKFALKTIKDTNDSYRSIISKEYNEIAKLVIPVKKKEENGSVESITQEEIFKENALKCIEEWTMGINGEMFRASLRMLALQYKCYQDMKLFSDHIYKTFMDIQRNINAYYLNEIKSVDRLCKYLQMAVEGGRRIPETLILEHEMFIIDPNLLQFALPEPPVDSGEVTERELECEFKLSQLAKLRSQFKIIAPTGIALQQAFIYIIQDFTFFGKENCDGPLFPEMWIKVNPDDIPKLVFHIFGETCYVDWRDFLIYCLNIRFPTVDDLLELRRNLRCCDVESTELISRSDFLNQEFWFDSDFDPDDKYANLRKCLIKHFLFELFEIQEDLMNYPAFLLAMCKNVNPIEGFVMALSMAVGKRICYVFEECEEVVCKLIKDKQYRDECLACANRCTQQFLDKVISKVVDTCEGTTVIELEYTEEPVPDKKGKKGKGSAGKSKKLEASQSARLPKMSKSNTLSKSKMVQSETDVKSTYICKPCEKIEVEEKSQEKEQVEEEQKPEPQADPDLAYSVSQSVIWNVLKICLPWHFVLIPEERKTLYVDQVEELMKKLEVDTDEGDIYVCKFVNDKNICKILHKVKKFTALNFVEEVLKLHT